MPKQLHTEPSYIAPEIKGEIDQKTGKYTVKDERNEMDLDPNNIDDKIKIYERQVKEWFLDRASIFLKNQNNEFIVLMIAISYIEGVQQYINGETSERKSERFFKQGLKRIFSLTEQELALLDQRCFYEQVRCGLFHDGMTRNKVIIKEVYKNPIDLSEENTIKINPKKFLEKVSDDFNKYIKLLRDPNSLERVNFDKMYNIC